MSCDVHEHYDAIDTERLTYLDLSFDKLKLLPSNLKTQASQNGNKNKKKLFASSTSI